MSRTLIPTRSHEYEVEDDVLPDSSSSRDEDEESLILSASTAAAAAALAGGAEASMSMADIDMTHRAVFSRHSSKSGSGRRRFKCKRVCIFLMLSTSVAALVTYLLRDRIDIGIDYFGTTLDLDAPLEWLGLHSAFVLETSDELPSYGADLLVYRHKKTDAKVAALVPKQPSPGMDKAFGIGFRTKPTSSNGVAHILEHSVLCGSKKYMAKDPFVYLLKGSLHTFLNAFTYSDRTLYPVASRNSKDFLNLVDVYLDAVFNPRCVTDEGWWVLRQEGWRYEDDGNGGLEIKGVVYSEMLGAYSDPDEVLYRASQSMVFPDNTYFWDSGGAPSDISSLTREDYISFYEQHYTATNSKTFVTGDAKDVKAVLHVLDGYLKSYELDESAREQSRIVYQSKKFKEPVRTSQPYPSGGGDEDDDEEGGRRLDDGGGGRNMLITWLIDDDKQRLSPTEELAFRILDVMLLDSSSSVLYKALANSGLGEEVISDGVDRSMLQMTFQVGMKGIEDEKGVVQTEEVIMQTLLKLAEEGFDKDDIQSSLNSFEFSLREFSGGIEMNGIDILTTIFDQWNYDIHPIEALAFDNALQELKRIVRDSGSGIFQNLIREYLLNNSHRAIVDLYPSPTMEAEQLAQEKQMLAKVQKSFSPKELQDVLDQAKALEEVQKADDPSEAVAAIPSLTLADLDRDEPEFPIHIEENAFGSGVTLVKHVVPASSGIAYFDLGFDMSRISYEDIPLVPFLERMMLETGTTDMTDVELDRLIGMHTGGIEVERVVEPIIPDGTVDRAVSPQTRLRTMLFIRGKSMSEKTQAVFNLMLKVLVDANFDSPQKAKQMLREAISDIESDISSDGDDFAIRRLRSKFSVLGFLGERWSGTTHLAILKDLLKTAKEDWPAVRSRLERMRKAIIGSANAGGVILNFSGDQNVLDEISIKKFFTEELPRLQGNIPASERSKGGLPNFLEVEHPWVAPITSAMSQASDADHEAIVAATKVSYIGEGGRLFEVDELISGSFSVVSRYLSTGYLWDVVRVLNGAYGANSYFYTTEGILIFMSYRDPNDLSTTLAAYDGVEPQLHEDARTSLAAPNSIDLTRAIIGAIGRHDGSAPSTDEIGWMSLMRFLRNESPELRQRYRAQILETQADHFEEFAQRLGGFSPTICAVTSKAKLDDFNKQGGPQLKTILSV